MKKILLTILILLNFAAPAVVFAIDPPSSAGGGNPLPPSSAGGGNQAPKGPAIEYLDNPLKAKSVKDLIFTVTDLLIFLGVLLAVIMFIYVGFKFVMAQGDPKGIADARRMFYAVVIGTAILIGSKVIVEVVKNTFIEAGVVDKDLFNKQI